MGCVAPLFDEGTGYLKLDKKIDLVNEAKN